MTDWIKAIHPMAVLDTEAQALAATRASSIGMIIGAGRDAILAWYAANAGAEATRLAVDQMTQRPETAEQMQAATQIGLAGTAVMVVLQLALAVVHWRKPSSLLPLVFLMLVVWALGTGALAFVYAVGSQGMASQPMGLIVMTLVTMSAAVFLHATAIRGAGRLAEIRKLAAN
jgi:hypothetical protein